MDTKSEWRPVDTSEMISNKVLRGLYSFIQPYAEKRMGFDAIAKICNDVKATNVKTSVEFIKTLLSQMAVDVEFDAGLVEQLRQVEGPVVFAANHPYGCIDSMALMLLMEKVRSDGWKMLANKVLRSIEELQPVTIPVDPFASGQDRGKNMKSLKEMLAHLLSGGAVGMFPARRVSELNQSLDAVCDLPWTDHAVKFANKVNGSVVVLHIDGQNSDEFLKIPTDQLLKRSLSLAKEVPKQKGKTVKVRLGRVYSPTEVTTLAKKSDAAEKLRASCYAGAEKSEAQLAPVTVEPDVLESKIENESLQLAVDALKPEHFLYEQGEMALYLFQGKDSAELLHEIGRCREVAFQQISAGSGNEIDLTDEDSYYHHLLLWDKEQRCLVGAYRIGFIQDVIRERGVEGIYLDHVFKFSPEFYNELGAAMELSRSFILPEFQKNPKVLDMLWKGLGITAKLKGCYTMFGSVTISAAFTPLSQSVLVETLDQYHGDSENLRSLVQAKIPFAAETKYHPLIAKTWQKDGINRLNAVIEEFEDGQRSIPPLIRYYISLGAKFLAFNVEPTFNNAIYCLLRVDLKKMPVRYRKRFLGE